MSGMRDVAKLAGVSLSTVSVVLNSENEKYVSEEQIQRVMEAVDQLHYNMPPKKHMEAPAIAVLLPVIARSFFPNVLAGIEAVADKAGYSILYFDSGNSFEKEQRNIEILKKQHLKGIIIDSLCTKEQEPRYLDSLVQEFTKKKKIRIVFLERILNHDQVYSIGVDNYSNAYKATKHLIDTGHKKIAHIAGSACFTSSQKRLEGYMQALLDSGIPYQPEIITDGDFSPLSGYMCMKKILVETADITALFSANDQMAIGAIKAIKESGRKVPEDIAVVGFDNVSHSSLIDPALTTINVPTYQLGSAAARLITEDAPKQRTVQLEANLIVRKSSNLLAPNEWELVGW